MENKQTIAVKVISPAATLKSISVGETRVIRSREKNKRKNFVPLPASRLARYGYTFYTRMCPEGVLVTRTQ